MLLGDLDRWSTYLVPLVGGGGTVPYLGIITWANDKKKTAHMARLIKLCSSSYAT